MNAYLFKRWRSKIIRLKRAPVEFLIDPTEHAHLCGAERLQPTASQVDVAPALGWNLRRLLNGRSRAVRVQLITWGQLFVRLRRLFERVQQLTDPLVQRALVRMRCDRLHDADGEPVFGMVELIDRFTRARARRLLPLKNLFDLRMPDRVHTWIVIEKPLDHIGERLRRDHALRVARERRRLLLVTMRAVWFELCHI